MTLAQTVAETTLSLEVNGSTYTCLGTGADCSYSTSSSMPVVTSIALQDSHTLVGVPCSMKALDFLSYQETLFVSGSRLQAHDFFSSRLAAKTSLLQLGVFQIV